MAVAFIQSTQGSTAGSTIACTPFASAVAAGETIVVGCGNFSATPLNVTDNYGNTYVLQDGITTNNGVATYVAHIVTGSGGATDFTVSSNYLSFQFGWIAAHRYSGADPVNPVDQHTTGTGASGVPTAGPVTTTANGEAIFAIFDGSSSSSTSSADTGAGFNSREVLAGGLLLTEDQIQTSAGSISGTFTSVSGAWAAAIVTLKGPSGAVVGESDVVFTTSGTLSNSLSATSAVTTTASLFVTNFAKLGDWDPTAYAITWFDGTEDSGGWWDRVDIPTAPAGAISAAATVVFTTSGTLALVGASNVVFAAQSTPTITGSSSVIFAASGTLSGTGVLVGASGVVFATAGTLTGAGVLVGASNVVFTVSTTPTIHGESDVVFTVSATLAGTGALTGESDVIFNASATGTETGALVGASAAVFAASATATGAGALVGASAVVFTANATPAMEASSTVVFTAAGTLVAKGALSGESDVVFSTSAALGLVGRSAVVFDTEGALSGAGALAGEVDVVFVAAATIQGSGPLAGVSAVAFATSGTLGGKGALVGESDAVFAASMLASGALVGESDVVFTTSGTIGGGIAPSAQSGWQWAGGKGTSAPSRKRFRTAADVARELAEPTAPDTGESERAEPATPVPAPESPTYQGPLVFKATARSSVATRTIAQLATGTASHHANASHTVPLTLTQRASGTALHHATAVSDPYSAGRARAGAERAATDAAFASLRADLEAVTARAVTAETALAEAQVAVAANAQSRDEAVARATDALSELAALTATLAERDASDALARSAREDSDALDRAERERLDAELAAERAGRISDAEAARSTADAAQANLDELRARLAAAEDRASVAESAVATSEAARAADLAAAEASDKRLVASVDSLTRASAASEASHAAAEVQRVAEITDLRAKLAAASARADAAHVSYIDASARADAIQAALDAAVAEADGLGRLLEAERLTTASVRQDAVRAASSHSAAIDSLTVERDRARAAAAEQSGRADAADRARGHEVARAAALEAELAAKTSIARRGHEALEASRQDRAAERVTWKARKDSYDRIVTELTGDRDAAIAEVAAQAERADATQAELDELVAVLADSQEPEPVDAAPLLARIAVLERQVRLLENAPPPEPLVVDRIVHVQVPVRVIDPAAKADADRLRGEVRQLRRKAQGLYIAAMNEQATKGRKAS